MTEKKVEYLELIYDLIFVYIIGRNNSMLMNIENGFVKGSVFAAYVLCTLAVIQIWNYSTYYMNLYGRNSVRDHVFLFINMYLLYYVGEGIRVHWEQYQTQFHIAWALILINIGIQYAIEMRHHRDEPAALQTIKGLMTALFGEAAIVLLTIPVLKMTGFPLAALAILFGMAASWFLTGPYKTSRIDFNHLSERAMLYVVFTFGEMIIAVASYFEEGFNRSSVYFSLMCFLIVAGLFLSYEIFYNKILDRNRETSGMRFMMIHIFLIFSMNNITTSLEFMRNPDISVWPKTLFLTGSFLLFFACLFALLFFAKAELDQCKRFMIPIAGISAVFAVLMILLREEMRINILISVIYVYIVFLAIYYFSMREVQA
ncbi:MAG: low temperature requirement protein A [Lachnospiraceae bacterium]|nr:low temperature requirement protein A [Lachnospiraceae bacterium]